MRVPFVSREDMQSIDHCMIRDFLVGGHIMMEHAGYGVMLAVNTHVPPEERGNTKVLVFAGKGNNGGDALCAARHLHNFGYQVGCYVPEPPKGDALLQLGFVQKTGIIILKSYDTYLARASIVIDGLFGINYRPPMKEPYLTIIREMNTSGKRIFSVDVPSGLDLDRPSFNECVHPSVIICMGLPKKGLETFKGSMYVADIGIVPELLAQHDASFVYREPLMAVRS